ncbi:MAG: helix-turn-helix domain-containing protein [Paracoccus sp. (in: a-proteobacteria)]|uniref:helix-turn-helix domain-containing protein n=1 Tax=Paracoccus sp. TaxID=267 RepID=UPI0039E54818
MSPSIPPLPDQDGPPSALLPRPADWLAAQQALSGLLARASGAVGRLDATLSALPAPAQAGAIRRLALIELEAMFWAQGTPLRREEIGREAMDARAGTDLEAMRLARWGLRRLEGQGALADLRGFLGLHRAEAPALSGLIAARPVGDAFDSGAREFLAAAGTLAGIEPAARAPALRAAWRLADLSAPECLVEPACWTGRDMALGCEALQFVPLGRHGRAVWIDGGPALDRMRRQLEAVHQGAQEARRELMRVRDWAARARLAAVGIKGENPARVIEALAAHPLMSAAMVEQVTGISRDTAERLLTRLRDLGLVREITGARRFRLWTAGG